MLENDYLLFNMFNYRTLKIINGSLFVEKKPIFICLVALIVETMLEFERSINVSLVQ